MILNITPNQLKTLTFFFVFALFSLSQETQAQTRVYANSATVSNASHVDNPANAYDGNLTTFANVKANAGLAAGLGAYNGYIELQFPSTLPANTTSYVKIETQDDLLNALLGGNLGGLLADVLGVVLTGSQEFTVQAKNNTTIVLQGDSFDDGEFATDRMRIIVDDAGDFYVMITPNQAYNRIRITNRTGSLLGLGAQKNLSVYGAYYVTNPANCGQPVFTSFSASGLNLDLIDLGVNGVQNPENAIDADPDNFSTLSFGVLGVAGAIEQTVYFEGASLSTDEFTLRMRLTETLLDLNIANNISVRSYNGSTLVQDVSLSTLLTLNLLNLNGGEIISIPIAVGAPVDRITLEFSSFVGLSLTQNLDFFGVVRTAARPEITDPDTLDAQGCEGSTIDLFADTDVANELRWYDAEEDGNLLATVASGDPFTTPTLTTDVTYYVAAARIGCPEESLRIAVDVTVNSVATPTGDAAQSFCSYGGATVGDLIVNESNVVFYDADTAGNQYLDTDALTDGTVYYAAIQDAVTGCESATRFAITVTLDDLCDVTLNVKVLLQGALYGTGTAIMRDDLRTQGLIPVNQPYDDSMDARFTHIGGGSETTTNTIINTNAGTSDAIVDWIFIEIRDTPTNVFKTVSALLQRDGDVIASDGGPLVVSGLPETFYISVKHRNHFGAMGLNELAVVNSEVTIDFTTIDDADLYSLSGFTGSNAMVTINSVKALYSGNANYDDHVKYDGAANDRQVLASQVLNHESNTNQVLNFSSATGYLSGDVNMDGKVLYDGAGNERVIIQNIILTYPLNTNGLSNYNGMVEQIPQ